MSIKDDNHSRLILLIGSNPLPNFLSVCALQPDEFALVYTRETEVAKDRLKSELRRTLGKAIRFVEPDPCVGDATCATTVRRVIDSLLEDGGANTTLLNYTGGTKVMAAHARMAFAERGGESAHCMYLDEGDKDVEPRLRYDNGRSEKLADSHNPTLDLRTLLALHGIKHKPRTSLKDSPTTSDANAILCSVLRDPSLAKKLYGEKGRLEKLKKPSKALSSPFRSREYELDLSIQALPESGTLNRKSYKRWYKFIGGEWLEEWIGTQLRSLSLEPNLDVVVGVNAFRGEARVNLEVDVAAVNGHRSYFISCTTDTTKTICKSKLFEIAVRSRQLGGDLARAALVCLADDEIVSALQQDINDLWGATNTTQVFGLSDLRNWSGCDGRQPNRYALQAWMES